MAVMVRDPYGPSPGATYFMAADADGNDGKYGGLYSREVEERRRGQWTALEPISTGTRTVTYVTFDPVEELLWSASEAGRVTSSVPFFREEPDEGPLWNKYSSFQAHSQPVSQLRAENWGVLSLSQGALRVHAKGGLPTHIFSDEGFTNLLTFAYAEPMVQTTVVLGGNIPSLLAYDIHQNMPVASVGTTQGTAVLKNPGRCLVCGGTAGDISMRDPLSLKEQSVFRQAHATISDVDVKGTLVASCGFTQSLYEDGQWEPDPLVKVFDLRMPERVLRTLQPSGVLPYLLQFHPIFPSLLAVVGQTGGLQFWDVNTARAEGGVYQVFGAYEAATRHITAFDISSSAELLAFGDNTGIVHTWGLKEVPVINNFSDQTDFPINGGPNVPVPVLSADGTPLTLAEDSPLSSVPMPESEDGTLLSDWPPPHYTILVGQKPRKIKPNLLKPLQYREFVGHLTNPGMRNLSSEAYEASPGAYPDPWPHNESWDSVARAPAVAPEPELGSSSRRNSLSGVSGGGATLPSTSATRDLSSSPAAKGLGLADATSPPPRLAGLVPSSSAA
eukprot:RCo025415